MRLTAWCQKRALPDYRNPQKDRKGKKSSSLRKSVRFYLCAGVLWKIIGDDGILPCKEERFRKLFPSSRSGNGRTGSFGVSVHLFQLNVDLPTPTFFWSSAFPPHITKVWPTSGPCSGKDCRKTQGPWMVQAAASTEKQYPATLVFQHVKLQSLQKSDLVGGFNHLEKYESQWEGLSHIWKIKFMFQTTNQWCFFGGFQHVPHFGSGLSVQASLGCPVQVWPQRSGCWYPGTRRVPQRMEHAPSAHSARRMMENGTSTMEAPFLSASKH